MGEVDKKWLPLTVVLGAATVAVVTASVWPDDVEKPPLSKSLCHGALSREAAELIDDGKGGEVSTEEWESRGSTTDYAVFRGCHVQRADSANDEYPRGVAKLVVADTRAAPYVKEGATLLGTGFDGWALPDQAEVTLPAGCAVRMGSTAPYITATLAVPSQDKERLARRGETPLVDADTALHNNKIVMRDVATRLAERYGCAG